MLGEQEADVVYRMEVVQYFVPSWSQKIRQKLFLLIEK